MSEYSERLRDLSEALTTSNLGSSTKSIEIYEKVLETNLASLATVYERIHPTSTGELQDWGGRDYEWSCPGGTLNERLTALRTTLSAQGKNPQTELAPFLNLLEAVLVSRTKKWLHAENLSQRIDEASAITRLLDENGLNTQNYRQFSGKLLIQEMRLFDEGKPTQYAECHRLLKTPTPQQILGGEPDAVMGKLEQYAKEGRIDCMKI